MTDLQLGLKLTRAIRDPARGGGIGFARDRVEQMEIRTMQMRLMKRRGWLRLAQRIKQREGAVAIRRQLRPHHIAIGDDVGEAFEVALDLGFDETLATIAQVIEFTHLQPQRVRDFRVSRRAVQVKLLKDFVSEVHVDWLI